MAYWGYHAMFDCAACDIDLISDKEHVYNFIKELVPAIDMVAFGEPMIEHFATHAPDKAGDAYIDIFSCKPVDIGIAQDMIQKYFDPEKIRVNFVTRSAG
jgi:S-adenosylmethionine/arginine decarboxylase-like enzyme